MNISHNKLTQIEENDLDYVPNIHYINLDFRNELFNQMTKLNSLSFRFYELESIDSVAFKGFEKIQKMKRNL